MWFKSISAKLWIFAALFTALLASQFALSMFNQTQLANDLDIVKNKDLINVYDAYQLKITTAQVHQRLTDTRALDGLNGGFNEAEKHRRLFMQAIDNLSQVDPENSVNYRAIKPVFEEYYRAGKDMAQAYIDDGPAGDNKMVQNFNLAANNINAKVDLLLDQVKMQLDETLQHEVDTSNANMASLIIFLILYIALLAILIVGNRLGVIAPIKKLSDIVEAMANRDGENQDNYDFDTSSINTDRETEVGKVGYWINQLFSQLKDDYSQSLEREKINQRIKLALDVCDTNVMMADADLDIIYMNTAVQKMMQDAEADIRKDLPHLDAKKLMGKNIDTFHKNPAHQRGMLERLQDTYRGQISMGGRTFGLIATPIFGENKERLGTVVEWNDKTERLAKEQAEEALAAENARIKQALDKVSANVMVADADRNIIYANTAVVDTLRNAESDLRKDLPNFSVDTMVGANIDQFHKNPSHQIQMLDRLTNTMTTQIIVGGRHMQLIVSPVIGDDGERLGTVVEWADRTAEVKIQDEMDNIIAAANDGNLAKRIGLDDKDGFFRQLSQGLNTLLDKTASFVHDMGNTFEAMAEGDLTSSITNEYRGEFDKIKTNANNSMTKLSSVLLKIHTASGSVKTSANEVAQGSDDLARRTESQASSLEETASSMEQITSTVKQSADNANQANSLASEAKTKAESGGEVVQGAVKAMAEILESSNKINDIIGVIDEIAFQTNLLALNAAVEAARAGEQGRGFAVVAGEVRTLSQRSAAAAKEIKDLIRDSVNKVESGSTLVNESGKTLSEIVTAVEKVANMINDVSNAANEQTAGIGQINQAITQMDSMTQQNAALVEETSSASRSMSEESANMNNMISFFKLGGIHNSEFAQAQVTHSANVAPITPKPQEPIKSHAPATNQAVNASNEAAGFSEHDDWEDF